MSFLKNTVSFLANKPQQFFKSLMAGFILIASILFLSSCTSWYMLTTPSGTPVDHEPGRTLGTKIDDMTIQAKVEANLYKSGLGYHKGQIKINSHNGIVLLTGTVPTATLKTMATKIAKNTRKVRQVHNKIAVGANLTTGQKTRDGLLAMKLKSKLNAARLVPEERIEVITSEGVAYLMGMVTPIEDKRAVQAISTTRGLNKIVKVFEIISPVDYPDKTQRSTPQKTAARAPNKSQQTLERRNLSFP